QRESDREQRSVLEYSPRQVSEVTNYADGTIYGEDLAVEQDRNEQQSDVHREVGELGQLVVLVTQRERPPEGGRTDEITPEREVLRRAPVDQVGADEHGQAEAERDHPFRVPGDVVAQHLRGDVH